MARSGGKPRASRGSGTPTARDQSAAGAGIVAPGRVPGAAPADRTGMRVPAIDTLRGIAILAMIAYHFAFDLRFFGLIAADFENDPFWLGSRAIIVSAFLALVGVSLVLADRAGASFARFARRLAVVALCALAASLASYFIYPKTYIYFGILHCIVVSSLIARPLVRRPGLALAGAIAVIALGLAFSHPGFDTRATSWIGFTTVKPPTQDFVPLFPWLGVVLAGVAFGAWLDRRGWQPLRGLATAPAWLRFLGRHSLAVYMIHQPILMGALWLSLRLAGAGAAAAG
jgi:uncharacterized membrane protein